MTPIGIWYADGPGSPRISPDEALRLCGLSGDSPSLVTLGWTLERHAWIEAPAFTTRAVLAGYGERIRVVERHGLGQVRQRGWQCAHVGREDADRRAQGPRIGLCLGHAGAGLDVCVQRNGDRCEDTDDGHHDHQLDEREAALIAQRLSLRVPETQHWSCLL